VDARIVEEDLTAETAEIAERFAEEDLLSDLCVLGG
jgi:hypothetical protein